MGVSVPPEPDPITAYNAKYGGRTPASGPDPVTAYNAKYGKQADQPPMAQKIAETLVSGFPGATRAVAGYRGLVSLLSGEGIDAASDEVNNAMSGQKKDIASMPWQARLPLQIAGGAPAGAALSPMGIVKGGATFGALQGADQPASSLADRAKNTGTSAVLSALLAKGGQFAGKGVANISARTGLTDLLQSQVNKISPEFAATMGTRGQVNDALSNRQDILDAVGAPNQTAAQQQLTRIANTKAQAATFYNKARADKQILDDPQLNTLLSDPQVQKGFQYVSDVRAAKGNPLPISAAPSTVPLAAQKLGITQEAWDNAMNPGTSKGGGVGRFLKGADAAKVGTRAAAPTNPVLANAVKNSSATRVPTIQGADILPAELMGPKAQGVSMPDPEALSSLKQHLWSVAQGKPDTYIGQQDALQLIPKVNAIRNTLHGTSPDWAKADAFYSDAKGQEEAFANGYDAIKHANGVSGATLPENSPEAMLKSIETPRYPNEPPQAMARRAEAFRQGMKAFTAGQIQGQTVDKGASSALGGSALEPTQSGAQLRQMMMGGPAENNSLEQILAQKRGQTMQSSGVSNMSRIPVSARGLIYQGVRKLVRGPDLVQTPQGQSMLAQRLGNQPFQDAEISNFRAGTPMSDQVKQALAVSTGAQVAKQKRLLDAVNARIGVPPTN
jgi:hypothetical protein